MKLVLCPRCELNYMGENEKMCSVCRREVKGEGEQFEMIEMCSECGENPVVPGKELCTSCLKELARRSAISTDDSVELSGTNIEIDSVSSMDEIAIDDLTDNPEGEAFDDDDEFEDGEIDDGDDDDDDDDDDEDEDE